MEHKNKNKISLRDKKKHMKDSGRERSPQRSSSVPAKRATGVARARERVPSPRETLGNKGHSSDRLWSTPHYMGGSPFRIKFDIARRWPATLAPRAVNNKSKSKNITLPATPEMHPTLEWCKVYTPIVEPYSRERVTQGCKMVATSYRSVHRGRGGSSYHPLGLHSYRGLRRKRSDVHLRSKISRSALSWHRHEPLLSRQWATSKIQEQLGGNERDAMIKLSGGNYKLFLSKHKVIKKIIKDNLKLLEISKLTHVVAKRHDPLSTINWGRSPRQRGSWLRVASVNFWITTTWLAIGELFSQIKKVRKNRGMYLQVSGRLGRAKMARKKRFKKIWGVVNNASATTKGEFSSQQIHTKLGVIGLKVYSC